MTCARAQARNARKKNSRARSLRANARLVIVSRATRCFVKESPKVLPNPYFFKLNNKTFIAKKSPENVGYSTLSKNCIKKNKYYFAKIRPVWSP
jgi:hypothetical protein